MTTTLPAENESLDAIAERLQFLRSRVTNSQTEFARTHGISVNTWNNYERAVSRIRVDEAKKLHRAYGASLDWIYLGIEGLMPAYLIEEWRQRKGSLAS